MRTFHAKSGGVVSLGRQGENKATAIVFDFAKGWADAQPGGSFVLLHQRPGEAACYPVTLEVRDGVPVWLVSNLDTAIPRAADKYGHAELRYTVDDMVIKSAVYSTMITEGLDCDQQQAPESVESWVESVLSAVAAAEQIRQDAENGLFNGRDGYTPEKGTDYWTQEDKDEIVQAVISEGGGAQDVGLSIVDGCIVMTVEEV